MTPGDLTKRGHYLGSNVSHTLGKLVKLGYFYRDRSTTDKRSVRIRLTPKGGRVRLMVEELFNRHSLSVEAVGDIRLSDLTHVSLTLKRLERFWVDQTLLHV